MEKISNQTELAVIFKRYKQKVGPIVFLPETVLSGKLDTHNMIFIDWKGNRYPHIFANGEEYGFAMRATVGELNPYYQKKTLSGLCKAYLKDLQLSFYYYMATDHATFSDLEFIMEDSKYHTTYFLSDRDLKNVISKRVETALLQQKTEEINMKQLIQEVKQKVIGQDDAIEDIVSLLWQNSKSTKKKNMIVVGSTGVGKTEIFREISKKVNIPMVVINAASLTQSGFMGESVDDILKRLLYVCNHDVKKAESGIIVLDEIDKLASSQHSNELVATLGVQYELLKLLEDGTYYLNIGDTYHAKNVMVKLVKLQLLAWALFLI